MLFINLLTRKAPRYKKAADLALGKMSTTVTISRNLKGSVQINELFLRPHGVTSKVINWSISSLVIVMGKLQSQHSALTLGFSGQNEPKDVKLAQKFRLLATQSVLDYLCCVRACFEACG